MNLHLAFPAKIKVSKNLAMVYGIYPMAIYVSGFQNFGHLDYKTFTASRIVGVEQ